MDEKRFRELEAKRGSSGLTAAEADELGRMIAEREGKPYSNAGDRAHPDALTPRREEQPYDEAELREAREHPDVHGTSEEQQVG